MDGRVNRSVEINYKLSYLLSPLLNIDHLLFNHDDIL